ncbi:hypothetical protein INT43_007321 [Umbelopsis isabellina]|uniref:HOOK N-terminal domain-containing protein n=1 Tax=Mortierella isabellina TaxID=91625 RepID=A0A8H7UE69_MORIS|nr:hypothetical protein INT43_007321 [Umbelopsis isabellina]
MSQESNAAAFVEWVNSFDRLSHSCTQITDLSDGIILFEVLANIDSTWFKLIRSADLSDNWVLKFNNLKKLYKLVTRYYEEVLGQQDFTSKIPQINLTAIAKDADVDEILKLCQLVIVIAVLNDNNSIYIEKMQSLSQSSQHALMVCIEQVMVIVQGRSAEPGANLRRMSSQGQASFIEGENLPRHQHEGNRLALEKEELEKSNQQLIEELGQLRYKYDELDAEKAELKSRLHDMDSAVAQANETGRTDFIMRTEIEHLRQDLQRSEDRRQESEMLLDSQGITIADLNKRVEELTKKAEQSIKLKDQLDEYKHAAEKLHKTENVIEKYKKKLEESNDLRRQIKALEDQNVQLLERNQTIEEEYRKVLAFKTLMDSYKDQVAGLETKNNELLREKNRVEYDLQHLTKKVQSLEEDKANDTDQIQLLEDRLQEFEINGAAAEGSFTTTVDNEEMDVDGALADNLESSLKGNNVTQLRLTIRRLERKIKTMEEDSTSGGGQKVVVLQHLLEDANRMKSQFEKDYLEASQERDILNSDMARIREGIPDALLDQSQNTMSLRLHIIDMEKESKSLRDRNAKLEARLAQGSFPETGGEPGDLRVRYQGLETRANELEEQTKKQLQDINKLLLEKDMLQSQSIEHKDLLLEKERVNSELKASLVAINAKDDEPLKQQNAHLQDQVNELQIKIQKAKEFIKQQDKMLKESKIGNSTGNFDEAVMSLKAELQMREDEIEKLQSKLHEVRLQSRREQQLIISAWYNVRRQNQKENVNHTRAAAPSSWLGQQRRTLDNQLRRQ